jgi:hypothetical protein
LAIEETDADLSAAANFGLSGFAALVDRSIDLWKRITNSKWFGGTIVFLIGSLNRMVISSAGNRFGPYMKLTFVAV